MRFRKKNAKKEYSNLLIKRELYQSQSYSFYITSFLQQIEFIIYRIFQNYNKFRNSMSTLYQKLGGEAAINAVVDKFYDLMLVDSRINQFYQNINLKKLRCRQKQFITLVTGGPSNYEGTDMKTAHCKLNISKEDFDITWEHLQEALKYFSVQINLISQLKKIFYSVEGEIVKKGEVKPIFQENSSKTVNVSRPLECPFKSSKSKALEEKKQVKHEQDENCPMKLNNKAYLQWNY